MRSEPENQTNAGGVQPIIEDVRKRYKLRVILKGTAIILAVGLATFVLFAWGLEALRFPRSGIIASRVVGWGLIAGLAWYYLVRPLRRKLTDEQVALYLEEHEPILKTSMMGAVAAEQHTQEVERRIRNQGGGETSTVSRAFLTAMIQDAVNKAAGVQFGRRIEQRGLVRSGSLLGGLGSVWGQAFGGDFPTRFVCY